MPLTKTLKDKLQPDFLATLVAVGESLIAAQAPPSVAYALRDELPFESWPDDAIEAVARLVVELRRRLAVATRELLEAQPAPKVPAAETAPPAGNKGQKHDRGKHRGTNVQAKKPENAASPPTEKGPTLPHGDKAA